MPQKNRNSKEFSNINQGLKTSRIVFPSKLFIENLDEYSYKANPKDYLTNYSPHRKFMNSTKFSSINPKREFVHLKKSPDLGHLNRYIEDEDIYHPDMYDDNESTNKIESKRIHYNFAMDNKNDIFDNYKTDSIIAIQKKKNKNKNAPTNMSQIITKQKLKLNA